MKADNDPSTLLSKWEQNLQISRAAHYESAKNLSRANYLLGIPVTVLSAVVGTSILATVQEDVGLNLKILAGLISMLAAILAGLNTFLRFEERAEKHRTIGARCAALMREIEEALACSDDNKIDKEAIKSIRNQYDKITLDAPPTSQKMYERALVLLNMQKKEK